MFLKKESFVYLPLMQDIVKYNFLNYHIIITLYKNDMIGVVKVSPHPAGAPHPMLRNFGIF